MFCLMQLKWEKNGEIGHIHLIFSLIFASKELCARFVFPCKRYEENECTD